MTTFAQLKSRIINILINALQVEADAQNTHMLLGGLLLCVQDSAIFEDGENNNEQNHSSPAPSDMNLLSSGKCTVLLTLLTHFDISLFKFDCFIIITQFYTFMIVLYF